LDDVSDVNFIAIPGRQRPGGGRARRWATAASRQDCFFIADAQRQARQGRSPTTEPVQAQDYMRNKVSPKNSYGALYYPWLEIADRAGAGKNPKRFVPPSGFIAGLYARIDHSARRVEGAGRHRDRPDRPDRAWSTRSPTPSRTSSTRSA
jgi:hypothetical protein